jgi:hypothetical protein
MSVDCWSFRKKSQNVERLAVIPGTGGLREFASLGRPSGSSKVIRFPLPGKLLIHGKATLRRTNSHQPALALTPIQTILVDNRLPPDKILDAAWCSLAKNDADTATICVLATVDAPPPETEEPPFGVPHVISWRVNPAGITFELHMVWLTAVRLDVRRHRDG